MARAPRFRRRRRRIPPPAERLLGASLLAAAALFAACQADRTPELLGAWQAEWLIEEGDTVEVRLDDVGLYFDADGSYVYTSTLDHEEAGAFRLDGDYLYTTPGGQDTLRDRPVQIARLDAERLHIRMLEGDKVRVLQLARLATDTDGANDPLEGNFDAHDHDDPNHVHDH